MQNHKKWKKFLRGAVNNPPEKHGGNSKNRRQRRRKWEELGHVLMCPVCKKIYNDLGCDKHPETICAYITIIKGTD